MWVQAGLLQACLIIYSFITFFLIVILNSLLVTHNHQCPSHLGEVLAIYLHSATKYEFTHVAYGTLI